MREAFGVSGRPFKLEGPARAGAWRRCQAGDHGMVYGGMDILRILRLMWSPLSDW